MTDNQKKLLNILREMFQFDQSDLDFGIYRIMRMKRDEISRFIAEELPAQITADLRELAGLDAATEIAAIDKQIADTNATSLSHAIKVAAIKELEEQKKLLAKGIYIADVEADIYNHLTNFFSRYYDDGDFISQRRYKDGVYAIPYEGEEVKLHWANADQYYVKTSEYFKDYVFKTAYGDVIRFKLIEAEVERDNNKAKEKRFFQLHTDKPFEVIDGALFIYVEYKTSEHSGNTAQAKHIADIVDAFTIALTQTEFQPFATILTETDGKSLLERQLNRYTARNTFDYFIHKDLGKFLQRELDFYIKNDVIYLDDIDEQDKAKTKAYLTKAKVMRKIARKIITFLAQIEDFQKKLYLKKKFVIETNYCITLDCVPEEMYPEIAANNAQREEWMRLFAVDEIEATDGDLLNDATIAYSVPLTAEFLKQNPFLVLDTAFFSNDFKEQLVASIEDLDEKLDGLLIHSENSQALNLLTDKYRQNIKCIYIDPPYNTDASSILYKNNYKHSSFLSLLENRLATASLLMKSDALISVAIDDVEMPYLRLLLGEIFPQEIGVCTIRSNPQSRKTKGKFSPQHEYGLFFGIGQDSTPQSIGYSAEKAKRYPLVDDIGRYAWMNFIRAGNNDLRTDRPKLYYPIAVNAENNIRVPELSWNDLRQEYDVLDELHENEEYVYPVKHQSGMIIEKNWQRGHERMQREIPQGEYRIRRDNNGYISIDFKTRMDEEAMPGTWWDKNEYASSNYGATELKDLFGQKPFDFPKAIAIVHDSLIASGLGEGDTALDFFAGSGTTGNAVINMNRDDDGHRKYILVEMGEYFDTVTKPRIEKVVYSKDWKDGKPISRKGISHAFKYLRLESYEDSLNNIVLTASDYDMLDEVSAREGYFLSYMLSKEAEGSASLLNVERLDKPFSYKMNITRNLESAECNIDLVETFNYLIGLTVIKSHALVTFDADFSTGEYGAISAMLKAGGTYKFKAVEGTAPSGDQTLVIWREMTGDVEKDNAALDAYFLSLPGARGFKRIYVNCDNNLMNLRGNDENWQVVLVDDEMKKRMFESAE